MTSGNKRRNFLKLAAGSAVAVGAGVTNALAEQKWWESVLGQPTSSSISPPSRKRRPIPLNDLRESTTPFRSDEMLAQMDEAIERYTEIVARRRWSRMPKTRMLRPDDHNGAVVPLRRLLGAMGDIPARVARNNDGSYTYDGWVTQGVKRFQQRHGLRATGRLDRPTRAQLRITPSARLAQLKLNRRRIAELVKGRVEDRYILVNSASFELEAVERYEVRRRHRVIVGKPDRQTPDISATIRALNFFPHWRVPDSVAVKDLIPRLLREPDYLDKEHIRAYKGYYDGQELDIDTIDWRTADPKVVKFKQDPGPWNALGLVRVDMPNEHIVYMHDTPLKPLFKQRHRAFSAGCVRVDGVMELVAWIAQYEPGFSDQDEAVQRILDGNQATDVKLTRPLPVYFTYITAWAEADGSLQFRPDIYGRDGASELVGHADPEAAKAAPRLLSP